LFRKNKVTRVHGVGRLTSADTVEVTGESGRQTLKARRVLIATGSKPAALKGIDYDGRRIVHSTDALTLAEVPQRLLVVGAGAIGLELGSVWMRLGSEVLVLEFMDRAVPGMDRKSGRLLQRSLERAGHEVLIQCLGARRARRGDRCG
jgi:dihydrolipoamide dehydrogenase